MECEIFLVMQEGCCHDDLSTAVFIRRKLGVVELVGWPFCYGMVSCWPPGPCHAMLLKILRLNMRWRGVRAVDAK